jgi:phosphate:Na+ symporter
MEIFMNILLMLGGVAVLMYGMKQMKQGIEQSAGSGISSLFKKINKNRMVDYGIGIGATAIVQSSSATSVMTLGLVNAGAMTVKQGSGVILGAKVGTTLTAFIFALGVLQRGNFSLSALFASATFAGVIILFTSKNDSRYKLAHFLIGFGMLFIGLEVMEFAIGGRDSTLSRALTELFKSTAMQTPLLLVLTGIIFTFVIQSSTAATGVFITFLTTGVIGSIDQSFFLIMGANIGTCLDAVLASIGTNTNAKRIALFHLLTSTIGAAMFFVVMVIFKDPITNTFERFFPEPVWSLAICNLIYNTIYTLILLAFLNPLVNMIAGIIKEKKTEAKRPYYIDDRLLATPAIAIDNALLEVSNMLKLAGENLYTAFTGLINEETDIREQINENEDEVDYINRSLTSFFIKLVSTPISGQDKKLIGGLHHVINDIERIGDHAILLAQETESMKKNDFCFIDKAKLELKDIYAEIFKLYTLCMSTFESRSPENLEKISMVHDKIRQMVRAASDVHFQRLVNDLYPVEISKSLYITLNTFQRVSDHLVNIAYSILSETGSKTEAFAQLGK